MMIKARGRCEHHVRSRRMEPGRNRGVRDMHVGLTMFPTDYAIPMARRGRPACSPNRGNRRCAARPV
jgi:hypothetical protein